MRNCANSIRANGQREPITLHRDGRVLDGKHRDRACIELGIPTASKTFDSPDTDLLELVLDLNLKRRHLTESQRAIIATEVATFGRGRPSNNAAQAAFTQAAAAKKFSVSPDSLQRARVVLHTPSRRSSPPSRMASYGSRWLPPLRSNPASDNSAGSRATCVGGRHIPARRGLLSHTARMRPRVTCERVR